MCNMQKGEVGNKFYIIKEGETLVMKGGIEMKEGGQLIKSYKGAYFGETALMEDSPRGASIVAVTDCEVSRRFGS